MPGERIAAAGRAPVRGGCPGRGAGADRLRVSAQDEAVLWAAGRYLGSLAGRDLARGARTGGRTRREGRPPGRDVSGR